MLVLFHLCSGMVRLITRWLDRKAKDLPSHLGIFHMILDSPSLSLSLSLFFSEEETSFLELFWLDCGDLIFQFSAFFVARAIFLYVRPINTLPRKSENLKKIRNEKYLLLTFFFLNHIHFQTHFTFSHREQW